jgi:hypothetical protein
MMDVLPRWHGRVVVVVVVVVMVGGHALRLGMGRLCFFLP